MIIACIPKLICALRHKFLDDTQGKIKSTLIFAIFSKFLFQGAMIFSITFSNLFMWVGILKFLGYKQQKSTQAYLSKRNFIGRIYEGSSVKLEHPDDRSEWTTSSGFPHQKVLAINVF